MKNTIGDRIRYIREDILELNGEEFGKLLSVTKTAVSNWEKGNRTADIHTLSKIADLGNVSLDFLACKTDDQNSEVVDITYGGKPYTFKLAKGTKKELSEQDIQKMIDKLETAGIDMETFIEKLKEN